MSSGLLWFDDDPRRSFEEKAAAAARRYAEKFGHPPNVCYVHPSMLDGAGDVQALDLEVGGRPVRLALRPRRSVLRDHFFVSLEVTEDERDSL